VKKGLSVCVGCSCDVRVLNCKRSTDNGSGVVVVVVVFVKLSRCVSSHTEGRYLGGVTCW